MFRFTIRDLLWLMVVVGMASSAASQEIARPAEISVRSFGRDNVIGHLGKPLGTIVRVTGMCVDGDSTRARVNAGKTLLQVESVDGRKLDRPINFDFERAAKEVSKPLPGQRFDYYVHEWGSFDGVIPFPGDLPVANDGFHYRQAITIHKDNAAAK
jgi:hypothetical protein